MASRSLYYRVAARLRGIDLEPGRFRFSGLRAEMYFDMMEGDRRREIDVALLGSRSAVAASGSVDFKSAMETVTGLRRMVADSLPYRPSTKEIAANADRAYAEKYMKYVESVVGRDAALKLMKTGKL